MLRTQAEELYGPNGYGERAAALQVPALANEKNIKAAADAAKKLADAYADLIKNITSKNAETQQELANQGKLTEAQKFEMDSRGKLAYILDQLSPKQRAHVEGLIREGVTLRDPQGSHGGPGQRRRKRPPRFARILRRRPCNGSMVSGNTSRRCSSRSRSRGTKTTGSA